MKTNHYSTLWPKISYVTFVVFALLFFLTSQTYAFKPKGHIYIGLKVIDELKNNGCNIKIDNMIFPADPASCNAIRKWPGYFLAGTIGPDGFPDIAFGQMKIHPDLRCTYSANDPNYPNGDCDLVSAEKSWTDEWLQHLWHMIQAETGTEKEQALAFVMGYLTHAAGDMWCHTFVNQYAKGSWPDDNKSESGRNIIKEHLIVENIIGQYTPEIKTRVNELGGIKVPVAFLKKAFVDNDWAVSHGSKSFIGYFTDLRKTLKDQESSGNAAEQWLKSQYFDCWIKDIDKGLEEWIKTSEKIAIDLFVKEDDSKIVEYLSDFKKNYFWNMLGADPVKMVERCVGIPSWVINFPGIDPAKILNKVLDEVKEQTLDRIWNPLDVIQADFNNFLFTTAFGMTYDEFKNPGNADILDVSIHKEIKELLNINSNGYLDENRCAIIYNTIVLNKLILLNADNLNQVMFRYNVGNLYPRPDSQPNVMLGFIKSLDGNHQWRKNAPSRNIFQPDRSFSRGTTPWEGMPLWVDCLARKNFFTKVFKDWTSQGMSMLYKDGANCYRLADLAPVSARVRLLTNNDTCTPSYAEVTLTNHQTIRQSYAIYVTVEDSVNETPMTSTKDCPKVTPSGPIPFSPIIIKPDNIIYKNIFFYKVRRGELLATSTTCTDEPVYIQLPNCYPVEARLTVYILREVYTAQKEVPKNNTEIPPNTEEILYAPVTSTFSLPYYISCKACTKPACEGGSISCKYLVTSYSKPPEPVQAVTIKVPCETNCNPPGMFDADDDGVKNSDCQYPPAPLDCTTSDRRKDDNCPLNPNPRQEDCNHDLIGDACKPCVPNVLQDWTQNLLPDPRAEKMFHDLIDRGLIGRIIIDPISPCDLPNCMLSTTISGDFFTPLAQSIKDYTRNWIQGGVSDKVFFRSVKLALRGLSQQQTGARVTQATLTATNRSGLFSVNKLGCLTLRLSPNTKGALAIAVPRAMLDAKNRGKDAKYRVFIDGREVRFAESNNTEFRAISISVVQGAKNIQVFGNIMGPK